MRGRRFETPENCWYYDTGNEFVMCFEIIEP